MATSSGHWEVDKNGKQHYAMVSGGYVVVGIRSMKPKEGLVLTDNSHATIEQFANSPQRAFVKQYLGDKILAEVESRVHHLLEQKNKQTTGPGKES